MRYKFKFQSLLRYRRFLKEESELKVAKIMYHIQTLNLKKRDLENAMENIAGNLQIHLSEGLAAHEYQLSVSYVNELKNQIKDIDRKIEQANHSLEISRKKLIDRMVEVKKLEKLSEKDFERFKKLQLMKEIKSNEETYLIQFNNRN